MQDNESTGRYTEIVTRQIVTRTPSAGGPSTGSAQAGSRIPALGRAARGLLLLAVLGMAPAMAQEEKPDLPPEEDETFATPREYSFNPLQAKKELNVARFYMRKGSYRAAVLRAQEALKWDDSLLEAYIFLGEAREKSSDSDGALKAYQQYLELADGKEKERREVQRRVDRLRQQAAREGGVSNGPKP